MDGKTMILPAVTLAAGIGVGFALGGMGQAPETAKKEIVTRSDSRISSQETEKRTREFKTIAEIYREPGQTNRTLLMIESFSKLGPDDFATKADELDKLPLNERILASYLLYSQWGEVAPTEAMDHASGQGWVSRILKPVVLSSWASQDPENAAQYFSENPRDFAGMGGRGGNADQPSSQVAKEWARQDPEAALAWAGSLNGAQRVAAEASVFSEMATNDPAAAASKLDASPEVQDRQAAIKKIASEWGEQNWDEAKTWALTLPDDEREAAMSEAITGLARTDADAASTEVLAMEDGELKQDAIANVAREMSSDDAAGAIAWVMANGEQEAQTRALREAMPNWASQDNDGAVAWIQNQEAGEVRDAGAISYIYSNQSEDSKGVMDIAVSIENERRQNRAVGVAARQWMAEDPQAARSYIESSDAISDDRKERLLREGSGG